MSRELRSLLDKAREAMDAAQKNVEISPPTAANRAYYAAYYGVSALFLHKAKKTFNRHSAIEAAVYRDLVRGGSWSQQLGNDFRHLSRLRTTADYDILRVVSKEEAEVAVAKAEQILMAVESELPAALDSEQGIDPAP